MTGSIELNLPDGDWTCRWVGDLYYRKDALQGGITVASKVAYATNSVAPKFTMSSLYNLHITIPGSQLRVKNKVVQPLLSNAQRKRPVYLFPVTGEALTDPSSRIRLHLGLSGGDDEQAEKDQALLLNVAKQLSLPDTFGYSHAHCVPNTNPAYPIDYFLVSSYEVLRYFFLHEGTLTRDLLFYFTGKGERITRSLGELFKHPTGEPEIVADGASRVATLLIREGLTPSEIRCLARMAFIPEAYDCIEVVKQSLLLSRWENNQFSYGKLATVFPQNKPFEMAVCGQKFIWQDKRYLLVDQIYHTKEEMPFDQIACMFFTDHRSQAVLSAEEKRVRNRQKSIPRTITNSAHQRMDTQLGNAHQPASITDFLLTGYSFDQVPVPIIKVEKTGQTTRHQSAALIQIGQRLISMLEKAEKEAAAGRGKAHRQDTLLYTISDRPPTALFAAIRQLEGYNCTYLNLDQDVPSFDDEFYLNSQRGLNRPFDVVLCQLEPKYPSPKASIYLVWANAVRYGMFYAPMLRPLSSTVLTDLCNNYFGMKGVSAFGELEERIPLPKQHVKAYDSRNQHYTEIPKLAAKIKGELDNICDDQARRFS